MTILSKASMSMCAVGALAGDCPADQDQAALTFKSCELDEDSKKLVKFKSAEISSRAGGGNADNVKWDKVPELEVQDSEKSNFSMTEQLGAQQPAKDEDLQEALKGAKVVKDGNLAGAKVCVDHNGHHDIVIELPYFVKDPTTAKLTKKAGKPITIKCDATEHREPCDVKSTKFQVCEIKGVKQKEDVRLEVGEDGKWKNVLVLDADKSPKLFEHGMTPGVSLNAAEGALSGSINQAMKIIEGDAAKKSEICKKHEDGKYDIDTSVTHLLGEDNKPAEITVKCLHPDHKSSGKPPGGNNDGDKKKDSKTCLIVSCVVASVVLIGGIAAYFLLANKGDDAGDEEEEEEDEEGEGDDE